MKWYNYMSFVHSDIPVKPSDYCPKEVVFTKVKHWKRLNRLSKIVRRQYRRSYVYFIFGEFYAHPDIVRAIREKRTEESSSLCKE